LISIVESIQIKKENTKSIAGDAEVYRLREDYIPILRLHTLFNIDNSNTELVDGLLVVVESEGQKVGLFIDDLLAQQQVVIKSLETNYKKVDGVSGATILGDGSVAMILDVSNLLSLYREQAERNESALIEIQAA
jgi:two-component system chemotaxis sensor kinase CheA